MPGPEVVPAAAGVEGIAGLLLIGAFLILLGLQQTWRASIGWLLHKLADLLDKVEISALHTTIRPFGAVSAGLRALSNNVYAALGVAALKLENSAVWLFHQAERQLKWMGREIAALAQDTYNGFNDLITREIPAAVRVATRPLTTRLHGIDRTLHRLESLVHDQLRRLRVGIDRLEHIVTRTLPHAIGAVDAKVGRVGARVRTLPARLSRVEKLTIGAGAAAMVATALGRLGLRWLRCPALGRVGRKIGCGGFGAIEEFLSATFEAMVVVDLCRFALGAQQLARLIVPQLGDLLLLQTAVCLGGGATLPSAHDSPKLTTRIELPSAHD